MKFNSLARLIVASVFVVAATSTNVQAGGLRLLSDSGCDSSCESCSTCPSCRYMCKFEAKQGDAETHCYNVEEKVICIPKVVFPWQKSCCDPCVNNGACIKKVKVLKKTKYTCPACKYSWTPEKSGCNNGCCDSGCDSRMISEDAEDVPSVFDLVPVPVEEVPVAPKSARRFWIPSQAF